MEVTYVAEHVWKCRSAYHMYDRTRAATRNLRLTRFDRRKAALPYNLVMLTEAEASWHEAETRLTGSLPAALLEGRHASEVHAPTRGVLLETQRVLARLEAAWEQG